MDLEHSGPAEADDPAATGTPRAKVPSMGFIVHEYHPSVYRYAYRLTGSAADAEDLVQQTFLRAQMQLHQLRDVERLGGWLFRIARNCYLQTHRRRVPLAASAIELNIDEITDPAVNSPIDSPALQQELDSLPHDYRIVLLMFYFEELAYREIAENLEIPIGTVMSRLARAKRYLRSRLAERELTEESRSANASPPSATNDRPLYSTNSLGIHHG